MEAGRNQMIQTLCAICGAGSTDQELYKDTVGSGGATFARFSAAARPTASTTVSFGAAVADCGARIRFFQMGNCSGCTKEAR